MAKEDTQAPTAGPAPQTAEDPSRTPTVNLKASTFAGYPKTRYHPVYGAREIKDPNEEASLQPAHNWFNTAEEADAHRTQREAEQVVHYNARVRVDAASSDGKVNLKDPAVTGSDGIVRNSVTATESLKSGFPEPL